MTRYEMTPERWREVQWLFDAVLSREPDDRPAFLVAATEKDPALRREVESLIRSLEAASQFIEDPAIDLRADEPEPLEPGTRVGAYQLECLLGSGGAGRVYLATRADQVYEKQVAVKVIKRGMDTEELIRRFVSERQILAQLDHPHIAKLLDGGATSDGRPYLVMELVDGVAIDQWCAERTLGVRARIELFLAVCDAVQFAHRNLVIHRDLKPGNILVNVDGNPKLLDFGIAKLLDPDTFPSTVLPTAPGWQAMTPEYASPEQVRGLSVTTASDVYALGVVLYELLTGRRPYVIERRTAAAIERVVCETEPPRASKVASDTAQNNERTVYGQVDPRQLERRLSGDLDDILRMTLEKEPDRRYASVDQLAADLRRHLDGLPVLARRATLGYRAAKFVRRHKLAVAAATLTFLVLVVFLTTLLVQREQILRQRDRAETAVGFLINLFEISSPSRQRAETITARELLDQGARDIEHGLRDQPGLRGELLGTMGATYTNIGLHDDAEPLLEQSVALVERSYGPRDLAVATAKQRLADLRLEQYRYEDAEHLTREALVIRNDRLGEADDASIESLYRLAVLRASRGALDEADDLFTRAGSLAREHGRDELLIRILFRHGRYARYRGDGSAERILTEALERAEAYWGEDHPEVALILVQLAELVASNEPTRAEALYEQALAIQRAVFREPHPDLASTLNNRALFHLGRGQLDTAEQDLSEALSIQRAVFSVPSGLEAILVNNLAGVEEARGHPEDEQRLRREALELHRQIFGEDHEETANAMINLAAVLGKTGQLDEAEILLDEAQKIQTETFGDKHSQIAVILNNRGQIALRRGDLDTAEDAFARAAELLRDGPDADASPLPGVLQNLASIADRRGDSERAVTLYLEARDALLQGGRAESLEAAQLYNNLSVTKFLASDYDAAADWAGQAVAVFERLQEPGSDDRLRSRRIQARALEELGRFAEAEVLMKKNVEACRARSGGVEEACARHASTLKLLYEKWRPRP